MSQFCLLLLSLFFYVSTSANSKYLPDLSLIKKWDENFYNQHSYQPFPKIIEFKDLKKSRTLIFVATKHKDWVNSHKKNELAMDQLKPDIILIEGIGKSDGLSPRIWDEEIKQDLNVEGYENYFAYKLALERRIPFVGAELDGKMSDYTSYERDIAVLNYMSQLLDTHKKVLVIYGAGHFVQQQMVIEKMLGSAVTVR